MEHILKIDSVAIKINVDKTEEYVEHFIKRGKRRSLKIVPVFKDVRIFNNTLNHAVKLIRKAGLMAKIQKQESSDYLVYIIKIPNKELNRTSVNG